MTLTIRRLATIEEYAAAEELLQACWETGPLEAVPVHMMLTIQNESGLVLGAFTPDGRIVGFLLGFLGRDGAKLKHHSHMTGVHPAFRDQNIAYRLKMAQREYIIAQGLELCTWTYDPLECRNAVLNISKLGGVARTYKRNIYGSTLGGLNAALPTDRLVISWEVTSERVRRCAETGQRVEAPIATELVSQVRLEGDVPVLVGVQEGATQAMIGLQIPMRFQEVKRSHPDIAMNWRMLTRAFFERAFADGYTVTNMTPDAHFPTLLGLYTLTRA